MGIARGWEKRVIRTNITYAKRQSVLLLSLPSLALRFQFLLDCSCLLEYSKIRAVLQSTNGSGETDLEQL